MRPASSNDFASDRRSAADFVGPGRDEATNSGGGAVGEAFLGVAGDGVDSAGVGTAGIAGTAITTSAVGMPPSPGNRGK